MDPDSTLCYCFHVPKRKVVNFVRQTRPRKASQISECFGAGSGCGWCIPFLVKIHQEIVEGKSPAPDEPPAAEYEARRKAYLKGMKEGTRDRHRHADFAARSSDGKAEPPQGSGVTGGGSEGLQSEPLDYTRYFSRSRPDPEPETLEE